MAVSGRLTESAWMLEKRRRAARFNGCGRDSSDPLPPPPRIAVRLLKSPDLSQLSRTQRGGCRLRLEERRSTRRCRRCTRPSYGSSKRFQGPQEEAADQIRTLWLGRLRRLRL